MDEDSDGGIRASRKRDFINRFLKDVNFDSGLNVVGIPVEELRINRFKIRGFPHTINKGLKDKDGSKIDRDTKEFDNNVEGLKSVISDLFGGVKVLKQKHVTMTNKSGLTLPHIKHLIMGAKSGKEKVSFNFRNGTVIATPGSFHVGSNGLDRNSSNLVLGASYSNKEIEIRLSFIFVGPGTRRQVVGGNLETLEGLGKINDRGSRIIRGWGLGNLSSSSRASAALILQQGRINLRGQKKKR